MSEEPSALIERLDAATAAYEEATAAVADVDGTGVDAVPEHLRRFESILDAYEDRATGSGDFGGYLELRGEVTSFVDALPDDQAGREAFAEAADCLAQRRLRARHFEQARTALDPAREIADALAERRSAADELRAARRVVDDRLDELEARIDRLASLQRYADVDVDAPVGPIREPVETYNETVRSAFEAYRRDRPAVDVLELFALTDRYPLVDMPAPPDGLLRAVRGDTFGTLTVPELLEYADYSRSKLAHYVDDPAALQAAVAEDRLYLERIDATPFTVDWPPAPAAELRWQLRELESVVGRFAGEETMAALREVRAVTRDDRFAELRTVGAARAALDEDDRRRLATGELADDLAAARTARDRLSDALAAAPTPTAD